MVASLVPATVPELDLPALAAQARAAAAISEGLGHDLDRLRERMPALHGRELWIAKMIETELVARIATAQRNGALAAAARMRAHGTGIAGAEERQ